MLRFAVLPEILWLNLLFGTNLSLRDAYVSLTGRKSSKDVVLDDTLGSMAARAHQDPSGLYVIRG